MSLVSFPVRRLLPTLALSGSLALPTVGAAVGQADDGAEPVPLKVGLGYIPSVQFAQFYLADEAGYYDEAGLDVTFENKIDPELITLLARGAVDIGMADGTSVIPAVSQGIPVRYGATIYGRDPNVVFSLGETGDDAIAESQAQGFQRLGGQFFGAQFDQQCLRAHVPTPPPGSGPALPCGCCLPPAGSQGRRAHQSRPALPPAPGCAHGG